MGLMDREYMHRTPEEREADYKARMTEEEKHKRRLTEMSYLMSKGNNLTFSERQRLNKIFKENHNYMTRKETYSDYCNYDFNTGKTNTSKQSSPSLKDKKKTNIVPFIIFVTLLIILVLYFYMNPQLADFNIWN